MASARGRSQALLGLFMAVLFCAIVAGSLLLTAQESSFPAFNWPLTSVPVFMPSEVAQVTVTSPGFDPTQAVTFVVSPTAPVTFTPPPNCPPPSGAIAVEVRPGDTLESLAEAYETTVAALMQANCMVFTTLQPGMILYIPPTTVAIVVIHPSATAYPCGAPWGWVTYIVQSGDTLSSLSRAFGVSISELQNANCLGSSVLIYAGQALNVPNVPTLTPLATTIYWTVTPIFTVLPLTLTPDATFFFPTPTVAETTPTPVDSPTPAWTPTPDFIYPTPTFPTPAQTPQPTAPPVLNTPTPPQALLTQSPPPTSGFIYPTPTYP